jgi:hypothetical protein
MKSSNQKLAEIIHSHKLDYWRREVGFQLAKDSWKNVPKIWQDYYLEIADLSLRFLKSKGKYTKYAPLKEWNQIEYLENKNLRR